MTDQTPTNMRGTDTPAGANIAAFRYNPSLSANWICVVGNAGAYTTLDSGKAADTVTHSFDIVMNDANNTTTFSIDGTVVGTIAGTNPSGVGWFPTFVLSNTAAASINVNFEYMYASQDF